MELPPGVGVEAPSGVEALPGVEAPPGVEVPPGIPSAADDAAPADGDDDDAVAPAAAEATAEEGAEARLYKEAIQLQPSELKRLIEQLSAFLQAQQGPPGVATPAGHSATALWPKMAGAAARQDDGQDNVMYIPNKHVGIVIGKGGEMIRTLQDRSQARIQVQPDKERDFSADTRKITLTGAPAHISEAKRLIHEVVRAAETDGGASSAMPALVPPGSLEKVVMIPSSAGATPTLSTPSARSGPRSCRWSAGRSVVPSLRGLCRSRHFYDILCVPTALRAVGMVIGKGGSTIQMLQQQVRSLEYSGDLDFKMPKKTNAFSVAHLHTHRRSTVSVLIHTGCFCSRGPKSSCRRTARLRRARPNGRSPSLATRSILRTRSS